MALQLLGAANCTQFAQLFSPSGLAWYFNAARMAVLLAASARPEATTMGIVARIAPPIFRNWRRGI